MTVDEFRIAVAGNREPESGEGQSATDPHAGLGGHESSKAEEGKKGGQGHGDLRSTFDDPDGRELAYDLLITNPLVLQPLGEVNLYGKSNPSLGVGSGLSSGEMGLRLRYQLRRELAPYVGVTWIRTFGETTDLADQREVNGQPRLVTGVRVWF